ncbi:MAG TPA: hypothetical protein ENG10_00280 [Candidatus Bathyarchaeota archaeon]|nr:hypothetical protein [Candidatus Bathyarchaeota archaeon]HEX68720.1 hypothetical protein [Candidatus Bathyarchaeota archaeon]
MEALESLNLRCIAHGSIARGDVTEKSDVDIFIPSPPSSFMVETALEQNGMPINRRIIVQATPSYAIKAYIEIEENVSVSFPLVKLRPLEREFYKFGGEISLEELKRNIRVPGVDKRLMLIEPTADGHIESSIIGREEYAARLLGVSVDIVWDRVKALTRRDEIGRTGVFLERELSPEESFELVLKRLADKNPAVRRRMKASEK